MTEEDQKFWNMIHHKSDESALELVGIVDQITLIIRNRRFDFLDWIYEAAEVEKMNIATMVALIRLVYTIREMLPNWQMFVGKIKQEGERRGLNDALFLKGLI